MVHLLDLDNDISSLLLPLLNTPALCALASSSWQGFHLAAPALVRTIKLYRGPQQVLAFCEFTLKHHLSSHIISFSIFESATYSQPLNDYLRGYLRNSDTDESALFAFTLAEVLEGAVNLKHLAFHKCADLIIKSEQRIADIICHNTPVSLELSGGCPFQRFNSISGLVGLNLDTVYPPKYDKDAEQALDTILVNSIQTLETLSLGHALPANLRSEYSLHLSWPRVHYLCMTGVPLFPEQLARPFPNLRSLEITPSLWSTIKFKAPPPDHQIDCPSYTLWPALHSFTGPKQLALNLSQYHTLRRLSFWKWGSDGMYREASELNQLSDTVRNSDLRSLSLAIDVELPADLGLSQFSTFAPLDGRMGSSNGSQPLLDLLFSTLAQWASWLAYLCLDMADNHCLEYLVRPFYMPWA